MTNVDFLYQSDNFPHCGPLEFKIVTRPRPLEQREDVLRVRWITPNWTREDVCRLIWTGDWEDKFELHMIDPDTPTTMPPMDIEVTFEEADN